jgi:hypothetical protein
MWEMKGFSRDQADYILRLHIFAKLENFPKAIRIIAFAIAGSLVGISDNGSHVWMKYTAMSALMSLVSIRLLKML